MSEDRAPCSTCRATFPGLCRALDDARGENAVLRAEQYRRDDADRLVARAPAPTTSTARELRLELADAKERIAELERALAQTRATAAAERRRAEHAEDAQRRSLRVGFDVVRRA